MIEAGQPTTLQIGGAVSRPVRPPLSQGRLSCAARLATCEDTDRDETPGK